MAFPSILGGRAQSPDSILGGEMAPPRIPWSQNPMITMAGLSMLGAPSLRQGLQNVGANAGAGMAAKVGMQRDITAQQDAAKKRAAMNAVLKQKSGIALTPEDQAALAASPEVALQFFPEPAKPTDDISEYNFARTQGYKGTFQEWDTQRRQAGAAKTLGSIPPGNRVVYDEAGNPVSMEPIPGSPAAAEADAAVRAAQSKTEQKAQKADTMLDATRSIKEEMANAGTPVVGTASRPFALYSGSPAGRVRAYVGALKSGVGLQALSALKELSSTGASGFGALNQAELQLLLDQVGALDPDNTESDIFLKTIDRIEQQWEQILSDVEKTVPPERLAELGIDINDLRGGPSGGGEAPAATAPAPAQNDPLGIRTP